LVYIMPTRSLPSRAISARADGETSGIVVLQEASIAAIKATLEKRIMWGTGN
jgi:hypothetical protein